MTLNSAFMNETVGAVLDGSFTAYFQFKMLAV